MSGTSLPHQHELRECFPGSSGGRALLADRGRGYFAYIGRLGGLRNVARNGIPHMQELGRRSVEKRRWKRYAGPFVRRRRFSIATEVQRVVPHWPHQPARQRNRKKPLLIVTDSYLEEVSS